MEGEIVQTKTNTKSKIQSILLSDAPSDIALLLPEIDADFTVLNQVPCTMLCRWWAFFELSNLDVQSICKRLCFSDQFSIALIKANKMFKISTSGDVTALKLKLSRLSEQQYQIYIEIIGAFAVLNSNFEKETQLLQNILLTKQPHRYTQLCINERFLHLNGFSRFKIKKLLPMLLKTVIEQPHINKIDTLLEIAKGYGTII